MNKRIGYVLAAIAVGAGVVLFATRLDESALEREGFDIPEDHASGGSPQDVTGDEPTAAKKTGPAPAMHVDAPATTIEIRTRAPGEILPIDVSPGFEFLGQSIESFDEHDPRRVWSRRHQKLQGEPRDPGWSDRVEAALRAGIEQELTAHGFDTQRIEMPVIECRNTGCEIQAVAQHGDLQQPGLDFQLTLPKLLKGGLGNELELESIFISSRPDRRAIWLTFLARNEN